MKSVQVKSGQILRTALAYSVLTGKPITLTDILINRSLKGLSADKVTYINALAKGTEATISGVGIGSTTITFKPRSSWSTRHVELNLDGSVVLGIDALLLPLLFSGKRTTITLTGLTHPISAPSIIFYKELFFRFLKPYLQRGTITIDKDGLFPTKGTVTCVIEGKYTTSDIFPKLKIIPKQELIAIKGVIGCADEKSLDRGKALVELAIKPKPHIQTKNFSGEGISIFLSAFYGDDGNYDNDHPFIKGFDDLIDQPDDLIKKSRLFKDIMNKYSLDEYTAELLLPLLSLVGGKIPIFTLKSQMNEIIDLAKKMLGVTFTFSNGFLSCDGYYNLIEEQPLS